jgi:hypothetical protein
MILSVLIKQSIDMFKEINGLNIIIQLTSHELGVLSDQRETFYAPFIQGAPSEPERIGLIRILMKILNTAIAKWEH